MPKLTIDGLMVEVPSGTKVIDAAEMLSIMIPRFCYHEALGSVGACRMCAVKFVEGPVKGIQMSCMVDAQDGMVVSTTDEEAVSFRRFVIECLMLNHPHDCPVCDEGGQCLLQDETVSGGHGIRRYLGRKRTYRDQALGPFIAHEMNRCIHCYRCARFYQEYTGYRDLGVMQIGNRVYFGRHDDGRLESPFAGNLVDLCPTGVYTDKAARYRVRHWDLERAPSVCIHCSLGCSTIANARYREVLRVEARHNSAVNGHFICDRGRFGFGYTSHPQRPRQARVFGKGLDPDQAIDIAAERLNSIVKTHGPAAVAAVGSSRASLETLATLKTLCGDRGWRGPHFFGDQSLGEKTRRALTRLDPRLAVSMRDMESADFILGMGVDPVQEAPMLAVAMRQAQRKGAVVGVLDPRPVFLPFPFVHIATPPRHIEEVLLAVVGGQEPPANIEVPNSQGSARLEDLALLRRRLAESRRPVIVCSTSMVSSTGPDAAADAAMRLLEEKGSAGLFYVLSGPNAFGAAGLNPDRSPSFLETLEAIESGSVKALVAAEADLYREFLDRPRLEAALRKLELLLVLDYLPSETVWKAHCFVPAGTVFECDSSYINQEGRIRQATAVHAGGIPIWQETNHSHPLRGFRKEIPGGDPMPSWHILSQLHQRMDSGKGPPNTPEHLFEAEFSILGVSTSPAPEEDGRRILREIGQPAAPVVNLGTPGESPQDMAPVDDQFQLLLVEWTFGTEELSGHSPFLRKAEPEPRLWMHAADAAEMGLSSGEIVQLATESGPVEVALALSENMARSVLILPRHMQLEWRKFGSNAKLLSRSDILRIPSEGLSRRYTR
jgi:NADH-quinone oxidoreductase subunit G